MRLWQYQSRFEPISQAGENVTLDKWYQAPVEVIGKKKDISHAQFSFFVEVPSTVPEVVTLDKWFMQVSEPLYTKRRINAEQLFEPISQVSEYVLLDKWAQPMSQPLFDRQRRQYQSPNLFWEVITPAPPIITGGAQFIVDEL